MNKSNLVVSIVLKDGGTLRVPLVLGNFKTGEVKVTVSYPKDIDFNEVSHFNIFSVPFSSDGIMGLFALTDAIRFSCPGTDIFLRLGYLPYGRHDRHFSGDAEGIGIRMFANLVNAQNYSGVHICDPHNPLTQGLFNRCLSESIVHLYDKLDNTALLEIADFLIAPDAGAANRTKELAKHIGKPVVQLHKVRCGERVISQIVDEIPPGLIDKRGVIVDDICDGGRTFISAAESLREAGLGGELGLWVTCGLFTYGKEELKNSFDYIESYYDFSDCFSN